jgi:predicted permease
MNRVRRLFAGVRALVFQARAERELDDELRQFEDAARAANEAAGMSSEAARRAARVQTGSIEAAKDDVRDIGWESTVTSLWQDTRHAVRLVRKAPGFSAAVIATLGLGIGGTTAVFSIVDALYFRPPAGVVDPSLVRRVFVKRNAGGMRSPDGSGGMWPDAQALREDGRAFSQVAAYRRPEVVSLGRGSSASRVSVSIVSSEFFGVTGAQPVIGRLPSVDDDAVPGAAPVVVISHGMWLARFGGTTDVLGQMLLLNNHPLQIIGVAPRGFRGVDADPVDLWVPGAMAQMIGLESNANWRTGSLMSNSIRSIARLLPDADEERLAREASTALAHAAEATPSLDPTPEVVLFPIVLAAAAGPAWALDLSVWMLVAAGLVLVISCVNVVNLLLIRGVTRRKEIALRLSLGAGGWRIARQQLAESLVLGLLGGATGIAIAWMSIAIMQQFPLPPSAGQVDVRLLGFALTLSLLTAAVVGGLPALRARRVDPLRELKGVGSSGSVPTDRSRLTLVVVQVALSFALLVGAALFVRSLGEVSEVRGGADLSKLLTVQVNLSAQQTEPNQSYQEFFSSAAARLAVLPGVERSAVVQTLPFAGWGATAAWRVDKQTKYEVGGTVNIVGAGYFETAGTPFLAGRTLQPTDDAGSEPVAVVNEAMARLIADDGKVLGQCILLHAMYIDASQCMRVVGIVASQRDNYLDPTPAAITFLAEPQMPPKFPRSKLTLLVRTVDQADDMRAAVHGVVQGLREDLPFVAVEPLEAQLRNELQPLRIGAILFSLFGVLALLLSAVGLYGVLGHFVAQRTREVGIRRALGAPTESVVRLVAVQGLMPVSVGLLVGVGAAMIGSRIIESRLFGVGAHDTVALGTAAAFLIVVAVFASAVPVWRALRVDPILALRQE